jgi:PhnB protein
MASVSTYLNFKRETADAFNFYKSVFGTEFINFMRHGDVPGPDGQIDPNNPFKDLVINVQLPILGGHMLMGTDVPDEMGMTVNEGNNYSICLHPDSREETDRLFNALAEGGQVQNALADMFWGDYWGSLVDKFGIQWMFNHHPGEGLTGTAGD